MAYIPQEVEAAVCPFIDLNDRRCASRFSLSRMDEAFEWCLARHRSCVTYYQLLQEHRGEIGQRGIAAVRLTVEGRDTRVAAAAGRLRPTGS